MKQSYSNWDELKRDAELEKATDISKEKGTATVTFTLDTAPVIYKKQSDGTWITKDEPVPHRLVRRFKG